MKATLTGKFIGDWEPAAEGLMAEAEQGLTDIGYIALINKIDDAPKTKHGRFGFNVIVELTEHEIELLKNEAQYRMEYWSLIYQDCKADIDKAAHTAAKKLYLELGGEITNSMALKMGIKI
jgi:hypothetical protein